MTPVEGPQTSSMCCRSHSKPIRSFWETYSLGLKKTSKCTDQFWPHPRRSTTGAFYGPAFQHRVCLRVCEFLKERQRIKLMFYILSQNASTGLWVGQPGEECQGEAWFLSVEDQDPGSNDLISIFSTAEETQGCTLNPQGCICSGTASPFTEVTCQQGVERLFIKSHIKSTGLPLKVSCE